MPDLTEHPLASVLAAYQERRLPAGETLAVSDHLAGCAACLRELAILARRDGPADPEPFTIPADGGPPAYGELAALLDGELDGALAAGLRARVAASPHLAAELADLESFRQETSILLPRIHAPASGGPSPGYGEEAMKKVVAFPGGSLWRLPLSAAAVLLLMAAGWRVLHTSRPGPARTLSTTTSQDEAATLLTSGDGRRADLASLPQELRSEVLATLDSGPRSARLPAALRPAVGILAGEAPSPAAFKQTSPVGAVVRERRPLLTWTRREGAASYVVYLAPTASPDALQSVTLPGAQTDWIPLEPLTRGTMYEWQIEAKDAAGATLDRVPVPPAPETRFLVLDAGEADALAALEKNYAAYPLILGTAYQHAGLETEATLQFKRLARAHPGSAAARRLARTDEVP